MNRLFGTQLVRKEIVEQMLPAGAVHGVKGRFNATSAGVRALLGHPTSHEARKFMGLNSIRVFVPIPGIADIRGSVVLCNSVCFVCFIRGPRARDQEKHSPAWCDAHPVSIYGQKHKFFNK